MAALKNFLGLIAFVVILCVFAGIAFVVYTIVTDVTNKTKQKMEEKNISFTKDGMQVKMKERSAEQESDAAHNVLYKVWNAAAPPTAASEPKSWFGGSSGSAKMSAASAPAATPGDKTENRKPFSRSASSQQNVKKS